jgi:hypothetical protein
VPPLKLPEELTENEKFGFTGTLNEKFRPETENDPAKLTEKLDIVPQLLLVQLVTVKLPPTLTPGILIPIFTLK